MFRIKIIISLVLVTLLTLTAASSSANNTIECDGTTAKVRTVTVEGYQERSTIFNTLTMPPGQLDPDPIIRTRVQVDKDGCLVAHFSTTARPTDNWVVFQVLITGNGYVDEPLDGHTIGLGGTTTPVFYSVEETDLNVPRIVSRTFSKRVVPGVYEVKVLMAGGNNVLPGNEPGVWDPTLVLNYN
jgi:hypothetical protein